MAESSLAMLVANKLDGSNDFVWKEEYANIHRKPTAFFWVFFSTYLYLSFASRPHESDELYGTWKKFHKKVMTWLFGTLSTDIIPQVIDLSTDI